MGNDKKRKLNLPSKKSLKEAIEVFEGFRANCKYRLDVGLWATVDFPSKYHINKILQVQYRKRTDLISEYGVALTESAIELVSVCKLYLEFTRGVKNEQVEDS